MAISTAVDLSAVARVLGIQTNFVDLRGGSILFLPQRIAVIGQATTEAVVAVGFDFTKTQFSSSVAVGEKYGFGSPLYLAARELFPINGDGIGTIPATFYPLADGTDASISAITPTETLTGSGTFFVRMNNIDSEKFVINETDTDTIIATSIFTVIQATAAMPMIAVDAVASVTLTAKWGGASSNDIIVDVIGPSAEIGVSFAIDDVTTGASNPTIDAALAQFGG